MPRSRGHRRGDWSPPRTQDELDFGARLEVLEDERFELVCDCGYRDAPEIRDYITSGVSDDEAGIWTSYLLGRPQTPRPWTQLLATTPAVVATLDAVIATVGAGALAIHLGGSGVVLVVVCAS